METKDTGILKSGRRQRKESPALSKTMFSSALPWLFVIKENSRAFCIGPKSYEFRFTEHIDWSCVTFVERLSSS